MATRVDGAQALREHLRGRRWGAPMISMSSEVTPTSRVSTMYARGIAATTARATSANSDRYRNLRWLRNVGVLPEASKLPLGKPRRAPIQLAPRTSGRSLLARAFELPGFPNFQPHPPHAGVDRPRPRHGV